MTGEDLTAEQAFALLEVFVDVDVEPEEREAALNDPRIPDDFLLAFVRTLPEGMFGRALACLDRPSLLHRLLSGATADQRCLVAFNPATCSADLRRLASDTASRVRANVVYNPNTEPDVLASLLLDEDPLVKNAIETAFDTEFGLFLRSGQRWVDDVDEE